MPQDPFAKWTSKDPPKNDPFSKWTSSRNTTPTEPVIEEPVVEQPSIEEQSSLGSFWDAITKSYLPDKMAPLDPRTGLPMPEPDTYWGGFDKGLSEHFYEEAIKPTASILGGATAAFGGPIARGIGRVASKIPGAAKFGEFLTKERSIFSKPVGSAAKETAEEIVSSPVVTPEVIPPVEPPSTIAKLHAALAESKPLTEKQASIYKTERAKKFGEARAIDIEDTESGKKFMSQFAGEHTKVTREPLKLEQPDVDSLHKIIGEALKSDVIDTPSAARSIIALRKLLEGGVPQKSEIEVLEKVFGSGIAEKVPKTMTGRELALKTISIPKAIVSAIDLGIPFRQGINHVGQKEWRGMLRPAIEAYLSEESKDKWLDAIKAGRNFDLKKRGGLALGELTGSDREEHILNSFFGKVPGIRHSNRGYAVGMSKLRSDLFDTMYDDYKRLYDSQKVLAGVDKELLESAELFNPDNLTRARKMADIINTSTGRGSLGRLEPIAEELNATLFAPRLMSSRFKTINRVLNPVMYAKADPIQRKYAIKQLASITGTALTSAALFKAAGGEVETDPRSSDFLKGRIGKTRFDLGGGYLQYIVPMAKIMSATGQEVGLPIDHSAKSTKTGEGYNLGDSPVGQDKWDVFESFFTNKASPIASLFIAFMRGVEPSGKEVDFTTASPTENTALKSITPFMIQDFIELYEEDPNLIPLMIGSMAGGNVQVHTDESKKGRR